MHNTVGTVYIGNAHLFNFPWKSMPLSGSMYSYGDEKLNDRELVICHRILCIQYRNLDANVAVQRHCRCLSRRPTKPASIYKHVHVQLLTDMFPIERCLTHGWTSSRHARHQSLTLRHRKNTDFFPKTSSTSLDSEGHCPLTVLCTVSRGHCKKNLVVQPLFVVVLPCVKRITTFVEP